MDIFIKRKTESIEWTQGDLYIDGNLECRTLEDQRQDVKKVMHETRIPAGTYEIKLRTFGGHHERYEKKFPWHLGMLWLQDVPGFKDILIHIGNDDDDSSGCILVGRNFDNGKIYNSTIAYEILYKKVAKALKDEEQVFITVIDIP